MKISQLLKNSFDSVATLAKVAIMSRRPSRGAMRKHQNKAKTLIIMGNGPSLRKTIDTNFTTLMKHDRMAVNFAGNAPDFFNIRPTDYILADPHFFNGYASDENVRKLWKNLSAVTWPMRLHLPAPMKKSIPHEIKLPSEITLSFFNLTPGEGFGFVTAPLYRRGLAMPRPRNVLIPAIMEGIRSGYGKIYITGADHTWMHSLYVDDKNRVVSIQPHFYKDDAKELDRVAKEYEGYHLHDILRSMVIAFKSYHLISDFARGEGVEIFNSTEGSMIDAFRRVPLSDLK